MVKAARISRESILSGTLNINNLLGFVFGVIFICIMLSFAVLFPNPTQWQFNVFIVVLALAAAGVGAILPGSLGLQMHGLPVVRAGGALGMFVLIMMFQPTLEKAAVRYIPPSTAPEPVALAYLSAVDAGNISQAWGQLDAEAKGLSVPDQAAMDQIYNSYRKPLGAVISRELTGTTGAQSPSGMPVGLYRALTYRTKFAGAPNCRPEIVTLRATQELQWKVFSHQIGPSAIDC